MSRIELTNNSGKSWQKFQHNYIKGFAFLANKLLSEEDILIELLKSIKHNKLNEKLLELMANGLLQINPEVSWILHQIMKEMRKL